PLGPAGRVPSRGGVLGGTGDQGRGLAYRLARAGQRVILGSRAADRARRSGIVIAAVPWDGPAEILQSLRADPAGKLVVDCVNPLGLDKQGAYALTVPEGSDEPTTGGHGRAHQQAGVVQPADFLWRDHWTGAGEVCGSSGRSL